MALTTTEKLTQAFSLALEHRTGAIQDLVTNSNILWYEMKRKGLWKTFSGPTIRVPLQYAQSGTYVRYSGVDVLSVTRKELINDAEFEPKMGAVSVTLTSEEILKNSGRNQLKDVMRTYISSAESELEDRFVEDLHSAGALSDQIGGLQKAVPTTVNSGVYGGIDRSLATSAVWRTKSVDVHSAGIIDSTGSAATQFDKDSAQEIYVYQAIKSSRNKKGPNMILASEEHYMAYATATTAIQRINDSNDTGSLGYTSLKFYGGGRSMPVIMEGGIGTAMPSNVSYMLDSGSLCFYYHPDRNFEKFGGKQMPINQDLVVQHIGFMGELVLMNPLHDSKIYDSTPGS